MPSIVKEMKLLDERTGEQLWPLCKSLGAAFAESMIVPYHPGPRWSDPDVQARRRADIEKEQREIAAYHDRAARDQEERINREERERFLAQRRKQRG